MRAWSVPAILDGAAVVLLSARAVQGLVRFEPGQAFAWHHYYAATHNMQPFFCMFFCVTMYATTNRADTMRINEMAAELVKLAGTQVEAARISGVSQSNISRLVAGEIGSGTKADTERKIKAAMRKLRRRARVEG